MIMSLQHLGATPDSTLSIQLVRALVDEVERERGGTGAFGHALLAAAGLDPDLLQEKTTRVSRESLYRMFEAAVRLTGEPAFALRWTETLGSHSFSPLSALLVHAPTLREALEALDRYHRLLADQDSFDVQEAGDKVIVRCCVDAGESALVQRFVAEMALAGMVKLLRYFSQQLRPCSVSFAYPAPEYSADYERVFHGAEQFEQPYTGLTFDRALLNAPSPHDDQDVYGALRCVAEQRMLRLVRKTPYAQRVQEHLVNHGPAHRVGMAAVARGLGLSVRSLRRRLEAEGTTYNALLNESLGIIAKQLIRDGATSVQEIAFEMGFSDTSSFHRAFKRWTGLTPRTYQAALGQTDGARAHREGAQGVDDGPAVGLVGANFEVETSA